MNEFIDAHAHLIWPSLYKNIDGVLAKASKAGIVSIINCGVQLQDFEACVELSKRYLCVKNIIGIHPGFSINDVNNPTVFKDKFHQFKEFFIGVGEIGLDFLEIKDHQNRAKSEKIFRDMLDFASETKMPVVIHCRNAEKQAIRILEEKQFENIPGVLLHCFGGAEKFVHQSLDHHNWYFTIPTSIIFKPLHQNLAKIVPIERILLETDCPFLSPDPNIEINEPQYVIKAAEEVAKIKALEIHDVAAITTSNCRKFFKF